MAPILPDTKAMVFDLGDTVFHTVRHDRAAGIRRLLAHAEGVRGVSVDMLVEKGKTIVRRLETSSAAEATEYRQTDFHRILYGGYKQRRLQLEDTQPRTGETWPAQLLRIRNLLRRLRNKKTGPPPL
jgi:hypothetical protein